MQELLLAWYSQDGRDLPWRKSRDPYAILVSEVMLQQTQVERVIPRYLRWLERWPSAEALAAAPAGDVIREWQGLGYNRRAVALHRAAQHIADTCYEERIPDHRTPQPGVFLANFSQIFPEDRGTNFSVREGNTIAAMVREAAK